MSEHNPPAFPNLRRPVVHDGEKFAEGISEGGMTLRDYFAAAALTGMMVSIHDVTHIDSSDHARNAYKMADAMLKARES